MDFDTIMTDITGGLPGSPEEDIQYLLSQCEKYKDHEMRQEILRAIGRLIAERTPEEKKKALQDLIDKDIAGHKAVLEEVDFNMYKKDFSKALALLNPLIEKTQGMFEDDALSEYHWFEEPFEGILYIHQTTPTKTIRQPSFPFSHLYIRQASILFELGRHEEAIRSCEQGLRWNPMSADIMFELIENKKMLGDMDGYKEMSLGMFQKAFRPKDLAHCYRNMAYWFVEQKLYQEAMGCLMCSLQFEGSQNAQSEIFYVQSKTNGKVQPPTQEQFENIAKKYGFPIGPDMEIISLAYTFGLESIKDGEPDMARYFLTIINDLIHDERIEKMLASLPEEADTAE